MMRKRSREKAIERAILDMLSMMGAWVFKVHGHLGQRPGVPDILACLNGQFIAIEVKAPEGEVVHYGRDGKPRVRRLKGGELTELQRIEIQRIQSAGGIAFVARSLEDVVEQLHRHGIKTPFHVLGNRTATQGGGSSK
jgi:hypothetical protein